MTDKTFLPDMWRELCRSQSIWPEFGPAMLWFASGHDPKTFPDRLNRLFDSKKLAKARSLIAPLGKNDLEHLERLAEVNRRQAGPAARRALVTGITAPTALAIGLAQIFPAEVERIFAPPLEVWRLALVAFLLATVYAWVQYAQIRARQAEDLHDLITCKLSAARHEEAALTTDGDHKIGSPAAPAATVATP